MEKLSKEQKKEHKRRLKVLDAVVGALKKVNADPGEGIDAALAILVTGAKMFGPTVAPDELRDQADYLNHRADMLERESGVLDGATGEGE